MMNEPHLTPSSKAFPRVAAYAGIVANLLVLGYLITVAVAPPLAWLPAASSVPFRLVWYILIAAGLFRLSRAAPGLAEQQLPANTEPPGPIQGAE